MAGVFTSCGNSEGGTNADNGSDSSNAAVDTAEAGKPGIHQAEWGETDGKKVYLYTLTNNNGVQVKISNYGGTVTSWVTPDKNGNKSSVVLGFNELSGYLAKPPYFGATVGRYGNRIAKGKFSVAGKEYTLPTNDGPNHLHGGNKGFDKVVWEAAALKNDQPTLTLKYVSVDGEEGYPGNLNVSVTFTLTDANELNIDYDAQTDKPTPVNLTNHSYFNLTGDIANTILDHALMIKADKFTPVDSILIPTGVLQPVKGTPFDFTTATKVGTRIDKVKGGYDHNWVLNKTGNDLQMVATLSDATSGRTLEVYTTEPGLQFYSGNFLNGQIKTSDGKAINQHSAMCLETQHFPDSPNKPNFPSTILEPGQKYHTTTKYKVVLNNR